MEAHHPVHHPYPSPHSALLPVQAGHPPHHRFLLHRFLRRQFQHRRFQHRRFQHRQFQHHRFQLHRFQLHRFPLHPFQCPQLRYRLRCRSARHRRPGSGGSCYRHQPSNSPPLHSHTSHHWNNRQGPRLPPVPLRQCSRPPGNLVGSCACDQSFDTSARTTPAGRPELTTVLHRCLAAFRRTVGSGRAVREAFQVDDARFVMSRGRSSEPATVRGDVPYPPTGLYRASDRWDCWSVRRSHGGAAEPRRCGVAVRRGGAAQPRRCGRAAAVRRMRPSWVRSFPDAPVRATDWSDFGTSR